MTKNYTQYNLNISEYKSREDERRYNSEVPEIVEPSDSVIRNILNYSKALSVLSDSHTGNVHMILLN